MEFSSAQDAESEPRVKVLPRDEAREHLLAFADVLAKALDVTVKVPGTSWYIGLDQLLGLIPGIGDVTAVEEDGRCYDFVFVDQAGFEKHMPNTFTPLASSFTEYKHTQ